MSDFDYLETVLPGFTEAREIIKASGDSVFPLGYKGSRFDFCRFANRYRMAARFRSIALDDFAEKTAAGYSALTRVFLVWSVFERYADLAGDPPPYGQLLSLVPRMELAKLANHIERHDTEHRLFNFLHDQSLEQNRHFLNRYRGGDRRGVVFYAAAIRHIYVHGHLTAHPNRCTAEALVTICDALADFPSADPGRFCTSVEGGDGGLEGRHANLTSRTGLPALVACLNSGIFPHTPTHPGLPARCGALTKKRIPFSWSCSASSEDSVGRRSPASGPISGFVTK